MNETKELKMSLVINGVESFIGCVVDQYEENFFDDSYFYAVVWTGKGFETKMIGATAWGGQCESLVDAPKELKQKYYRHNQAKALLAHRAELIKIARANGLDNYTVLNPLAKIYSTESTAIKVCAQLLGTKKFRSSFRASLRQQLDSWLRGEGKYETPLSDRQIASLTLR